MLNLPNLPQLPDTQPDTSEAAFDWRKLLPALGGVALGGSAGGAFLQAFAQGQQMKQQRLQVAQEKRSGLRRDFLSTVANHLGQLDDPDEFEEAKSLAKARAKEFGVNPSELDVYAFSPTKLKRLQRQRAADVLNQVVKTHGADKFFNPSTGLLDATYTVDGQEVTGRKLLELAQFPMPKRTVTRPTFGEQPVIPETSARTGGQALAVDPRTGLPLAPQRVQTGEEQVTETILPTFGKRRMLAQYDPSAFAGTQFASTPVPTTKDGDDDIAAIVRYYDLIGRRNPLQVAKDRANRVDKDRADYSRRLGDIRAQTREAKTEAQFKAGMEAYNRLVKDFKDYKPWVGVKEVNIDVPTAVAQWRQQNARKVAGKGPSPTDVRTRKNAQAELDAANADLQALLASREEPFITDPNTLSGKSPNPNYARWKTAVVATQKRINKAKALLAQYGTAPVPAPGKPGTSLDEFYKQP